MTGILIEVFRSCRTRRRGAGSLAAIGCFVLSFGAASAEAAPWQEEQALDKAVGILQHPWRINMTRLHTRARLRGGAQVKTGVQPYDQQVERAQQAPQSLWTRLTAPVDAETPPSKPKPQAEDPPVRNPPPKR